MLAMIKQIRQLPFLKYSHKPFLQSTKEAT